MLNGVLYALRTGCQWKAAPKEPRLWQYAASAIPEVDMGANLHDMKGIPELIGEGFLTPSPRLTLDKVQHLCLDKGYYAPEVDEFLQAQGYILYTKRKRRRGEKAPVIGIGEAVYPARHWKVERTIS